MTLGQTLKEHRSHWGAQEKAARQLGISSNFLSLIENDRRLPSLTLLKRAATLYDCSIEIHIQPDEEHDIWRPK